jgi:hypothetical protein
MAKNSKAFISLGAIPKKNSNGVVASVAEYIVMPEANAKFIGATYSLNTPPPTTVKVTKGKLAGRTYTKEYSASISGTKYQLGFANGNKVVANKTVQKVRWISFFTPRSVNTRLFLSLIFTKISKQPIAFRTPDGVTTKLTLTK